MPLTAEQVLNRLSQTIESLKKEAKPRKRYVVWGSNLYVGVFETNERGDLDFRDPKFYGNSPYPRRNRASFSCLLPNADQLARDLADKLNAE